MSWKGKRGILLSESVFLNILIVRKRNYYSISLLAVTDANYKFIAVDVGSFGKDSDAGFFYNCPLRRALTSGKKKKIPEEKYFPGSTIKAPFVFLGDEAFL
jgi:hypothetical protein